MREYVSIDEEVELTLNSIYGIKVVPAPEFLYRRVIKRLRDRRSNIFEKISQYVSKPKIAICIILMVLILDFGIVLQKTQSDYSLSDLEVQSMYQEDYELAANFYDFDIREQ